LLPVEKEFDMPNGDLVEWVLPLPNPMNEQEFLHWESVNRPQDCVFLEEHEPVNPQEGRAELWRVVYVQGDNEWASQLL